MPMLIIVIERADFAGKSFAMSSNHCNCTGNQELWFDPLTTTF
jgi:hypothetical protein